MKVRMGLESVMCLGLVGLVSGQALFPATLQRSPNRTKTVKPEIYSLHIESHIKYRYAITKVSSKAANPSNISQEVNFDVFLPGTAFINTFQMIINGKEYKAFLKEKDTAKKEYADAIKKGQTAGHVAVNARDANHFTMSVNVEPGAKLEFELIYEELLTRSLGLYTHTINLNPGQIVRDFLVDVHIIETSNIKKLVVPELSTNHIISEDNIKENNLAEVKMKKKNKAYVRFAPSESQQAELMGGNSQEWTGQFTVLYDVDRTVSPGGQVLVNDGYFVHFFSPPELKPLSKYAVFVLDVSGSMEGRKLEQLKTAMSTILDELSPSDYFNIIDFSSSVTVHDLDSVTGSVVVPPDSSIRLMKGGSQDFGQFMNTPQAYPATKHYTERAKNVIQKMTSLGGTNIYDALKNGLIVAQRGLDNIIENATSSGPIEPIILFLTDGDPTVGITSQKKILNMVRDVNQQRCSIFSLGFGEGADINFLRKISLANSGFARTIYEAADAALQLNNFYKQVASPLLSNVSFTYIPGQITEKMVTKSEFQSLFLGSEIIVAGKVEDNVEDVQVDVTAITAEGPSVFHSQTIRKTPDEVSEIVYTDGEEKSDGGINKEKVDKVRKTRFTLERLWAYLSIKQMLDQYESTAERNATLGELVKHHLTQMALKYKFVTPFTSLIVVKPNGSQEIDSNSLKPSSLKEKFSGSGTLQSLLPSYAGPDEESLYLMTGISQNNKIFIERFDEEVEEEETQENELLWLPSVFNLNDTTISLPTGKGNTTEVYSLALKPSIEEDTPCEVVTELGTISGKCVHLYKCIIAEISQTLDQYLKYFCPVPGGFAGVCCLGNEDTSRSYMDKIPSRLYATLLG